MVGGYFIVLILKMVCLIKDYVAFKEKQRGDLDVGENC